MCVCAVRVMLMVMRMMSVVRMTVMRIMKVIV